MDIRVKKEANNTSNKPCLISRCQIICD